jgi:ribosome-associated translation inhibitor RaiA
MPDRLVQWSDAATEVPIEVSVDGDVDDATVDYAVHRLEKVLARAGEPLLFVRLRLTVASDPARDRPARAQASFDLKGGPLHAHAEAHDLREAADRLQRRLLDQLEQRASHRRAQRRRAGQAPPKR